MSDKARRAVHRYWTEKETEQYRKIAEQAAEIERLEAEVVQLKADLLAAEMGLKEVRGE